MIRKFTFFLCIALLACLNAQEKEKAKVDYTKSSNVQVGDKTPISSITTMDNKKHSLVGKVTLVTFFATWCPPCIREMPEIEKLWQKKNKEADFQIFAISRGEKADVVQSFIKKNKFTIPFALDPNRKVYSLFAKRYIPRNYLVNREGKIIYQSTGFYHEEFKKLVKTIEKELAKKPSKSLQATKTLPSQESKKK